MTYIQFVPAEEPASPVDPRDVAVVEQPKTIDPVARYRKNKVHKYSVQMAYRSVQNQGAIA